MDPLTWLETLSKALDKRAKEVEDAEDWYEGEHPIPAPPPNTPAATDLEARRAFQAMSQLAITNFLPPVVDVPASKLRIEGFRFGQSRTTTDVDLWDIYRRNHLVCDGPLSIHTALKVGSSFLLVWPDASGKAEVTVEDPEQTIVAYAAGSRRKRAAAMKRWCDDDGHMCANVYLPNGIYKYRTVGKHDSGLYVAGSDRFADQWEIREVPGEVWPVANPWGQVPIVELRVNAGLKGSRFGGGEPIFEKQITTQRRINRTVMGRLVTEDHQSYRQRWATDWDYPTNEDGTPDKAAMVKASAARLMVFNSGDEGLSPKVGEFAQADFTPFLKAVQEDVKVIATTSATPPYAFLLGDMVNVAADSLARIEGTHIANVRSLADQVSEAFVEMQRLALMMEGDDRWTDPTLSVVWGEFEQRTATEQANLAQIMKGLGAPDEVVYATLPGVDQAEAARWVTQQNARRLQQAALNPTGP